MILKLYPFEPSLEKSKKDVLDLCDDKNVFDYQTYLDMLLIPANFEETDYCEDRTLY